MIDDNYIFIRRERSDEAALICTETSTSSLTDNFSLHSEQPPCSCSVIIAASNPAQPSYCGSSP